jgi:hypothetical protein
MTSAMVSEPRVPAGHPWVAGGRRRVRFAVYNFIRADWPDVLAYVHRLEAWGFDAYVRGDHPTRNTDCWTIFSALAVSTTRIRLGVLVASIHYRHRRRSPDRDGGPADAPDYRNAPQFHGLRRL